jgi:hypothetical protein
MRIFSENLTSIEKQFVTTTKPSVSNESNSSFYPIEILLISILISASACQSPVITLIPEISSLEIRRSEDIYISSNIEFDCNDSFSIIRKWIISDSSNLELYIPEVERTHNELYIRPFTLSYGLYEFKLTAIITPSSTTIESKSLFVQIIPSNITVNLIQSATSIITHGHEQDLKLDPGSYSIDHDGYTFNANVSFPIISEYIFAFFFNRIGITNILVEFMVYMSHLISSIPHVYQTLLVFFLFLSNLIEKIP